MATRAAIAAADRKSREEIADKDRAFQARKWKEQKKIEEYNAHTDRVTKSASAAGQMARGTSSLMSKSNDPEWYKRYGYNPYAAALPDFYRLGTRLFPYWRTGADAVLSVPGVMVFTYQDTLPNQNETNVATSTHYQDSPINVSLTRFMANLRKMNSRIGDYDPADLGLYWYAIRAYITFLGMVVKAISIYNTYYATNAYFANILIEAAGFKASDFREHIAEYRLLAQKYINVFNANAVIPTQLSFILRAIWLSTCLIKDHEGDHAQIYMFRPYSAGYLSQDENTVLYSKITYPLQYSSIASLFANMTNNLFNSVGVVTMMADLRAAYGDNVLQFNPDLNATAQFSSSKHDLEQIHNLRTLPGWYDTDEDEFVTSGLSNLNIYQDNDGFLKQGNASSTIYVTWATAFEDMIMTNLSVSAAREYEYLDFYDEESCMPDMYLEATRLRHVIFAAKPSGVNGRLIKYCGTEVVLFGTQYNFDYTALDTPLTFPFVTDLAILTGNQSCVEGYISLEHQFSTFDWLPIVRVFVCGADYDENPSWYDVGEIDHAVTIPQQNLKWLHEVATLSEFYTDPIKPGRK